jgi:hypothetical protein
MNSILQYKSTEHPAFKFIVELFRFVASVDKDQVFALTTGLYTTTVHLSTYQFQQDALWFV